MKRFIFSAIILTISTSTWADEGAAYITDAQTKAVQAFRQMPVPAQLSGQRAGLIAIALWAQRGDCTVLVANRQQAWQLNGGDTLYRVWFKDDEHGDYYGVAASLPGAAFGPEATAVVEMAQKQFCR